MDRHTIIFTTDKRLGDLGTLLPGKHVCCSWDEYSKRTGEEKNVEQIYVLPTPVNKLESYPQIQIKLKEEFLSHRVRHVFGGVFDHKWRSFLQENESLYTDFMECFEMAEQNAEITAEGVIAEMLQLSPYSIRGQSVIVTGFGTCGKPIAKKLRALGAEVIIVARSEHARKKAMEIGYPAWDFRTLEQEVGKATTLINTVPAPVITDEVIRNMARGSVIIDIASKPGGTDFASAKRHDIPAKLALGLPGIYSTGSSAALYQKVIWENAPLQDLKRGEQSWIFQIII